MDRDTIIQLARESGIIQPEIVFTHLERFAALVAAAEREACAKLVEDEFDYCGDEIIVADAIRARGQK